MTKPNLLELAKQGDQKAITELLNQSLQTKGITAIAYRKDDYLEVMLSSAQAPEPQFLAAFILMEMISLGVTSIRKVKLYGWQVRTSAPVWHQEFELEEQVEASTSASTQSTSTNAQASFLEGFSRKRVSEAELRAALEECSKNARNAYEIAINYAKKTEDILQRLNTNISGNNHRLLLNKAAERFDFFGVLRDITSALKQLSKEGIEDLLASLNIKRKHLEDFTIALFGRTKAGKSTIREALTRGNGSTIGKGAQRTTRDVEEYRWQGLRLLDTPGIEAYQGEEDTAKANDIIDQSDMIIFLTSDDSVQPGEFSAMAQLQRINKYFAVILNVKHDISNQPEDLLMFLDIPEIVFDEQRLAGHQNCIQSYVKEHLEIENVALVCIHAQAAFLSTRPEYIEYYQRLWELSQIEELYYLIAFDIQNNGQRRRLSTFFDGSINFIGEIQDKFEESKRQLHKQINFMLEQKGKIKFIFEDSIQSGQSKIKNKCEVLYSDMKGQIGAFVERYAESSINEKDRQWKLIVNKDHIGSNMKGVIDEIVWELQEELKEFSHQYQYDLKGIKIDVDKVKNREIQRRESGRNLRRVGVAIGAVAGAAFVVANWWNPVGWVTAAGWIATSASVVTGLASEWKNKEDDRDTNNDIEQEKESLRKQVEQKQQETLKSYKNWLHENIADKFQKGKMVQIDLYIKGLSEIAEFLESSISEIQDLKKQIDTDFCNWDKLDRR